MAHITALRLLRLKSDASTIVNRRAKARLVLTVGLVIGVVKGIADDGLHALRPPRISDTYSRVSIPRAGVALAPNEDALAFVVRPSLAERAPQLQAGLREWDDASDIWVQDGFAVPARNLTNGNDTEQGSWAPTWSPDGARLAFFSVRRKELALQVWERGQRQASVIPTPPLAYLGSFYPGITWLDSARVLTLMRGISDDGCFSPDSRRREHAIENAISGWSSAKAGGVSASVVDSLTFLYPANDLAVVDIATGRTTRIARTVHPFDSNGVSWWLSPTAKAIAVVRPEPAGYGMFSLAKLGNPRPMEVRRINGDIISFDRPLPENVLTYSVRWSHNGEQLAFFAYGTSKINPEVLFGTSAASVMPDYTAGADRKNPAIFFKLNISKRTIEPIQLPDLEMPPLGAPRFEWLADGSILFLASSTKNENRPANSLARSNARGDPKWSGETSLSASTNRRWSLLDPSNHLLDMSFAMGNIVSLKPVLHGRKILAIADRKLWEVDLASSEWKSVALENQLSVVGFGSSFQRREGEQSMLIVSGDTKNDYLVSTADSRVTSLKRPESNQAQLTAVSENAAEGVYLLDAMGETSLSRSRQDVCGEKIVEFNDFEKTIRLSRRIIAYEDYTGRKRVARLYLPPGFDPTKQYPLITHLYPSSAALTERSEAAFNVENAKLAKLDVFAAAGFVVMAPDVPTNIPGLVDDEGESLIAISSAINPPLDRVIQEGFVDTSRIFLVGGSDGGWATAGVIALNNRFKAAISAAGIYDDRIFAVAGPIPRTFVLRHSTNPHDLANPHYFNKGYGPGEAPWWVDRARATRNAPFTYLDRVQTPLMIVHGDLDPVPMEGAEAYFYALASMRKPAQLVRYWGEGHSLIAPANKRDLFMRELCWLDKWGDMKRNASGAFDFESGRVKSRGGLPALLPEHYATFAFVGELQEKHR